MTGWAARLIGELDDADRRARALAEPLNVTQLNWRPAPAAWSVGQCLEHLCVATEVYLPAIAASLDGRPRAAVQEITPGWFARWFIRNYIAPSSNGKRATAPKKIAPSAPAVDPSVLTRFLRGNDQTREVIARAQHYDVNRIRFKNPFIPIIRFTVGTGLEIVSKHEQRHFLQAERVRAAEGFPR